VIDGQIFFECPPIDIRRGFEAPKKSRPARVRLPVCAGGSSEVPGQKSEVWWPATDINMGFGCDCRYEWWWDSASECPYDDMQHLAGYPTCQIPDQGVPTFQSLECGEEDPA
jgi:hypothetical protein